MTDPIVVNPRRLTDRIKAHLEGGMSTDEIAVIDQGAVGSLFPTPRFLPNGLRCLSYDNGWRVVHRREGDLRDALATLWWLHGAEVRTEVKVPDCGRIDVLVEFDRQVQIWEIKRSITTPTQARQACQQAHAYVAYLEPQVPIELQFDQEKRRRFEAAVTAASLDTAATAAAERAYGTTVTVLPYPHALHLAATCSGIWGKRSVTTRRRVEERGTALWHLLGLLEHAQDDLTPKLQQPSDRGGVAEAGAS